MSLTFFPIQFFETQNCLVVSIRQEIYDDFLIHLKKSIGEKLKESNCIGIILDVSSVNIMDSMNFNALINLSNMSSLLGKEMLMVGIQASIASALTELPNLELNKIKSFINLNKALEYLNKKKSSFG